MRWKVKPFPVHGDMRIRSRFIWLPERNGDWWYWLEREYWVQVYRKGVYRKGSSYSFAEWNDIKPRFRLKKEALDYAEQLRKEH